MQASLWYEVEEHIAFLLFVFAAEAAERHLLVSWLHQIEFSSVVTSFTVSCHFSFESCFKRTPGTDLSSASSLFFGDEEFPAFNHTFKVCHDQL